MTAEPLDVVHAAEFIILQHEQDVLDKIARVEQLLAARRPQLYDQEES